MSHTIRRVFPRATRLPHSHTPTHCALAVNVQTKRARARVLAFVFACVRVRVCASWMCMRIHTLVQIFCARCDAGPFQCDKYKISKNQSSRACRSALRRSVKALPNRMNCFPLYYITLPQPSTVVPVSSCVRRWTTGVPSTLSHKTTTWQRVLRDRYRSLYKRATTQVSQKLVRLKTK